MNFSWQNVLALSVILTSDVLGSSTSLFRRDLECVSVASVCSCVHNIFFLGRFFQLSINAHFEKDKPVRS